MSLIPTALPVNIGQNIPILTQREQPSCTYRVDWENKRVTGWIDGLEAMRQAIAKIVQTERFQYLIFSWRYGIELNALIGKSYDVVQSEAKRVMREALLTDGRITAVDNITITQIDKQSAAIYMDVTTIYGDTPYEEVLALNV